MMAVSFLGLQVAVVSHGACLYLWGGVVPSRGQLLGLMVLMVVVVVLGGGGRGGGVVLRDMGLVMSRGISG